MMQSSLTNFSRVENTFFLMSRFSTIASMVKSESFSSFRELTYFILFWMRCFSSELIFPFSTKRSIIFSRSALAFSKASVLVSYNFTEQPAVAATCAMPLPIVPPPIIPTFLIILFISYIKPLVPITIGSARGDNLLPFKVRFPFVYKRINTLGIIFALGRFYLKFAFQI